MWKRFWRFWSSRYPWIYRGRWNGSVVSWDTWPTEAWAFSDRACQLEPSGRIYMHPVQESLHIQLELSLGTQQIAHSVAVVSWTSFSSVFACFNANADFGDHRVRLLCFLYFFFCLMLCLLSQFSRSLVCAFVCSFLQLHFWFNVCSI